MNNIKIRKRLFVSVILSMMAVAFFATVSLAADAPVMSSDELITEAYEDDVIDLEAYIVQKLRSYFAPDTLDISFQADGQNKPSREMTTLLDEARINYDSFSDESKAFLDILFKRPDDATFTSPFPPNPSFFLPAPILTFEPTAPTYPKIGGKFKFHYVTHATADGGGRTHTTTLNFVKKMASAFETSYKTEVSDTLKYAAPPNDPGGADYGGDTKFDVYVMNALGFYGWVSAEGVSSGNSWYSFMVMDKDFTAFVTATITAEEAMQVTAAHEYHHAVQNGINAFSDPWYKEATATWMEDQVYDAIDDNHQYLNGAGASSFFNNPHKSLEDASGTLEYAHWIWNEFLEKKWDPDTIKKVWDNLDPVGKNNAVDAIVATLTSKSSSLKDAFTEFAAKNYSQKGFYKDAAKYDEVKIENNAAPHKLDYSTATSHKVDWQTKNVDHLASKYYKIIPGPTLKKPTMLSVEVDGVDGKDVNAIVIVKKKDGSFVEYPFTLDAATKEGEVGIPGFSVDNITEVVVALVNYSKTSADNTLEIKYRASLMKAFTFVIDDTGSMGGEIAAARTAANKVLDDNKAAGLKRFYTLISFKDGPGTIDGQSSDEDVMKGFINALRASGGAGCPESALLSIRQATELAEGGDIMMMTDATSNSFGVDSTFATWGEVALTIFKLLETNSRLSTIVFTSGCITFDLEPDGDESLQCPGCDTDMDVIAAADSSGKEGYARVSSESGGLFFDATTIDSEAITEIILRSSTTDSTISIREGDGAGIFAIPVDSSVSQFQIILNADPGSSLTLAVKNPGGVTVEDATDGVTVSTVVGSTHYIIGDAALATGNWSATISGTGPYRISAEASTTNLMTYTGDTAVGLGGTLNMEASLREAVSGVVFGLLRSDGTILAVVPVTTPDGLNFTATRVMNTVGSFLFGVIGDGSFMRINPTKITVGNLEVIAPPVKNVVPGTSFTHTFQFKNLGTESDTYNLTATSSEGWAVLPDEGIPVPVGAGGSLSFDITVNVPADATTGQIDRLSIQAVSQADPLNSSTDETETRVTTQPSPEITVSDSEKVGVITTSTGILIGKISLSAGTGLGENADWWIVADTPFGFIYLDPLAGWKFVVDPAAGLPTTLQGPLFDLAPPFEVLKFPVAVMPSGKYIFYFAVDTNMNGVIDFGELSFDSAEIVIP